MASRRKTVYVVLGATYQNACYADVDGVLGVTAYKKRAKALVTKLASESTDPSDQFLIERYLLDDPKLFREPARRKEGRGDKVKKS